MGDVSKTTTLLFHKASKKYRDVARKHLIDEIRTTTIPDFVHSKFHHNTNDLDIQPNSSKFSMYQNDNDSDHKLKLLHSESKLNSHLVHTNHLQNLKYANTYLDDYTLHEND